VAGTVLMIASAAQSFDLSGRFMLTNLFYSGLGISVVSLIALGICYWSFRRGAVKIEQAPGLPVSYDYSPNRPAEAHWMHIVEPIFSGIIAGLVSRRMNKDETPPQQRAS
jgi:hypothetical protein